MNPVSISGLLLPAQPVDLRSNSAAPLGNFCPGPAPVCTLFKACATHGMHIPQELMRSIMLCGQGSRLWRLSCS